MIEDYEQVALPKQPDSAPFFLFTLFILRIKIQFNAPLEIIKY